MAKKTNNQGTGETLRPQPIKEPRTVALATLVQSVIIAVLVSGLAGVVAGYFGGVSLHGDARAQVIKDMQVVTQATAKKADQ